MFALHQICSDVICQLSNSKSTNILLDFNKQYELNICIYQSKLQFLLGDLEDNLSDKIEELLSSLEIEPIDIEFVLLHNPHLTYINLIKEFLYHFELDPKKIIQPCNCSIFGHNPWVCFGASAICICKNASEN